MPFDTKTSIRNVYIAAGVGLMVGGTVAVNSMSA